MEKNSPNINYYVDNDFTKFTKVNLLTIENSHIYLTDFSLDLLNSNSKGDYLSFILHYVKSIIEKTENTTVLNILFGSEIDLLKIPFKIYENILFLFYSQAALTKFIENKKFFVSFPQLFQQEKFSQKISADINNKISFFDWVFIIYNEQTILDTIICRSMDEVEKEKFFSMIKAENEIEDITKKKLFLLKFEKNIFDELKLKLQLEYTPELLIDTLSQIANSTSLSQDDTQLLPFSFDYLALGGSFDHLHMGHYMLLSTALILCNKSLSIGVTSDHMISNKADKILLQSYSFRDAMVKLACDNIGVKSGAKISTNMISDAAGHAGTSKDLQALVLTSETAKGGNYVNEIRKKHGLPAIKLIFAKLIPSNEPAQQAHTQCEIQNRELIQYKMSSTALRQHILSEIPIDKLELLYKSWTKLTIHTLKCPVEISHNWFSILRDNYMQSWRRYHNLIHIFQFISIAENYFLANKIEDNINVLLSIWFHDAVYIPARNDNEERSEEMFLEFYEDVKRALVIENTLEFIKCEKVCFYIACTKNHFENVSYDDSDLNYLLDFDLMSFAVDEEKYFEINQRIKFEFRHHLSEEQWNVGRRKFLEKVLEKKNIYRTEEFRNQNENIARRNIFLELERFKNL